MTTTPRQLRHLTAAPVAVAAFCLLSGRPCAGKEKLLATFYTPPYTPSKCYGIHEHGVNGSGSRPGHTLGRRQRLREALQSEVLARDEQRR
ncbi:unnamed protein product [Linum trigynum]|uniref:Secreted protein n=1 Tax=Linum trigynum TaxID=586398 RepID=A0AAV2EHK7_9ROSI